MPTSLRSISALTRGPVCECSVMHCGLLARHNVSPRCFHRMRELQHRGTPLPCASHGSHRGGFLRRLLYPASLIKEQEQPRRAYTSRDRGEAQASQASSPSWGTHPHDHPPHHRRAELEDRTTTPEDGDDGVIEVETSDEEYRESVGHPCSFTAPYSPSSFSAGAGAGAPTSNEHQLNSSSSSSFLEIRRRSSSDGYDASASDGALIRGFHPFEDSHENVDRTTGRRALPKATKVQICEEVQRIAQRELRAEVERDARDGVAAIPPLSPPGWRVDHTPGTRYFIMHRVLNGNDDDGDDGTTTRVFRSVLDEALAHHRQARSEAKAITRLRSTTTASAASPTATSSSSNSSSKMRMMTGSLAEEKEERVGGAPARRSVRLDTHLFIHAPFRVQDLSLLDPKVPITEHASFDLYVHKRPSDLLAPSSLLPHQQRLWDDRVCLCIRLASVNSELRLRGVQFLSRPLERRLLETAVFGHGDPQCLAVAHRRREQRHRELQQQRHAKPRRREGMPASPPSAASLFTSPIAPPDATGDRPMDLLLDPTPFGELCRGACYHGPHLSELSRELHDALLEYVMANLGMTSVVTEYVCQMQYFLEQEEYMGWLARFGLAAKALENHVRHE